jgi:PIN domain nuclease of toxin-antitoxin system
MRVLFDTHILVWALSRKERVPAIARAMLEDAKTAPVFSAVSVWEVSIKASIPKRQDFEIDPRVFHAGLIDAGFEELPVAARHALLVEHLPFHHGDPFDRLLLAQAMAEGIALVTADRALLRYGSPVQAA